MLRINIALAALLLLLTQACSIPPKAKGPNSKPFVVLKLDDLWQEDGLVHAGWQQVVDFLNKEKVTGTIGLVCESLEKDDPAYFDWIRQRQQEGYEIWHHGYCHCRSTVEGVEIREFRGADYAAQMKHLKNAQDLASEKLGITLRSFGAPYNSTDEFTAQALAQIPDIKVWMYKETQAPTDKFVIQRIAEVNIEYPVHIPDLEKLKAGYEQFKDEPILVIQGHPRSWVEEPKRFETFKQIVHFLKAEGVRFTTPYAYYQLQQASGQ